MFGGLISDVLRNEVPLVFGGTLYATAAWIPPFLARVHHLSSAEIGTYAGTFKGLFGMAGTLVGGLVVAQISRRDDRWKLWAPAITSGAM